MLKDIAANDTDPGAYPTGNYKGRTSQGGVQAVWTQVDFGYFQLQNMVWNGIDGWLYRLKYVNEDWATKPWKNDRSGLRPEAVLAGAPINNGEVTVAIDDISNYQMLVLQGMGSNVTLGTTTIFRNRFLEYREHCVNTYLGIVKFIFETNTSVRIASDSVPWAIITGLKL